MSNHCSTGLIQCPVCKARHVPVSQGHAKDGVQAATCVQCGHAFKFRRLTPYKSAITITINDKQYTVGNEYDPSTSLNTFLRDNRISVGTKHMCFQGGCGSCLVEAKLFEPITEDKLSYAVNSCLAPLYSCDGMEIRTVDYIGNLRKGLHPIQTQIANYNGSQCGYCTPGQVMNMFALKEYYGTGLTQKIVEDSFDGVICRCTGYRPILAAFKNMIPPNNKETIGDIEDIKHKTCQKTGRACAGTCANGTSVQPMTHLVFADTQWFRPTTEKDITAIIEGNKGKKIRFLVGNTAQGVYSDQSPGNFDIVMDLTSFRELYSISFDTDIVLGAGLTLSHLIDICTRMSQAEAYFGEIANLLKRIANTPVRNRATWAGNLVMKHVHREFPSDMLVILHVLKAQIWTGFMGDSIDINDFMAADITNKLILAFSYTDLDQDDFIKFYKVQPRSQNSHTYVTGGFRVKVDKTQQLLVKDTPVLAYSGIGANFERATKTEAYLKGKQLGDPQVLKTALATLEAEVVPDTSPVLSSAAYRKNLAVSLFYKFVLHLAGKEAGMKYQSGASQLFLERPLSSGKQTYDTNKVEYPVTEPMKKLEANAQACGEAEYTDDIPAFQGQLEAAFVLSTVGNATLESIDATEALKIPGVVKVITAKDIVGENNWMAPMFLPEEVLASKTISYCGQPVAILLAESYGTALGAVYAVKVTYSNVQKPLIDLKEAISQKSFFPKPCNDTVVGDAAGAIANSPKKVTGSIQMGSQYHFHMETQASLCVPKPDGMDVFTSTQWIDLSQTAISQVTKLPKNSINISVKRLGGAYGAKITRNSWIAAACGLSAYLANRPVKLRLTLSDNMKIVGKRFPFLANYEAGFTNGGKLNGIKLTYYGDCGCSPNDNSLPAMAPWADNAYYCPNWSVSCEAVKTNLPANTACRSPGSLPAIFITETIMEHVAKSLNKDATDVRLANIYTEGQTNPLTNMKLTNCMLKPQIAGLMTEVNYRDMVSEINLFNQENRWKKKGVSMVPLKFGISWAGVFYGAEVVVYWPDGTVAIAHGGIEVGQGVNTKAAQVCAYELGIPMDLIKVKATNSTITANSITTGGSITSENICAGILECCNKLNARLAPIKAKLKDPTWLNIINKATAEGVDLSARFWRAPDQKTPFQYYSYGATITQVEFDVLTGEHEIVSSNILFDCGQSTNPALDIGQVEGAFVMGLGYWLTEQIKYDPDTGVIVTDSTWEYKPPSSKDIPVSLTVDLVKKNPNPAGVLGAKACGEPPMCMSSSALFALKHAIEAARKDVDKDVYFPLNGPATLEECQLSCLTDPSQFVLA